MMINNQFDYNQMTIQMVEWISNYDNLIRNHRKVRYVKIEDETYIRFR